MNLVPSKQSLGAKVLDLDLSQKITEAQLHQLIQWLGEYGVLTFPKQEVTPQQLKDFAIHFGELEINVAKIAQDPKIPEMMTLSNMVENGKPLGLSDAGQDWHTDMSYSRQIAFANILYGIKIPMRDGKSLGNTEFCNMHAAYDALPKEIAEKLEGKTITHDFNKFWEKMRLEKGSTRPPLTPEQLQAKPPVSHPAIMVHPITGKKVLYANPGYSIRINELDQQASDELLEYLFAHQLRPEFRYAFEWEEKSVLMWDNMGTIHNAVADYAPHEHRYIQRFQVAANRFF
ncbi:TauD/TfdA dioxygenase family protein [Polynucleobacter rarus]|uniref:TauD/TfdA dioxygenase family protein n=1 Tax=Polynucleobacter rarus TaxID=556055 RepID=UPI000D3E2779|nr:TauD/TfdA family dioxygenase [Polynucleobacter rarus]